MELKGVSEAEENKKEPENSFSMWNTYTHMLSIVFEANTKAEEKRERARRTA
jgi:hypothetical protein